MSVPEKEDTLLPLTQRWPRTSKFLLSGCAATVAELGTRRPASASPASGRGILLGEGWAGSLTPGWSIFRGCALARMWSGAQ